MVGTVDLGRQHTAIVQLLTDPRSDIGVRFGTGDVAVALGQGEGDPLQLQDVSETSVTQPGAPQWSRAGSTLPHTLSGIPVGTVSSVRHTGGSLTSQVLVTPLVNLLVLQYVAVLQWFPPA